MKKFLYLISVIFIFTSCFSDIATQEEIKTDLKLFSEYFQSLNNTPRVTAEILYQDTIRNISLIYAEYGAQGSLYLTYNPIDISEMKVFRVFDVRYTIYKRNSNFIYLFNQSSLIENQIDDVYELNVYYYNDNSTHIKIRQNKKDLFLVEGIIEKYPKLKKGKD